MFTEQQLAAFKEMNHEQIQKRFKEIQDEVNKNDPNTDLEMLQAEFDILQKRDKELQGKVAQRQAFLDTMAKSIVDEEETLLHNRNKLVAKHIQQCQKDCQNVKKEWKTIWSIVVHSWNSFKKENSQKS